MTPRSFRIARRVEEYPGTFTLQLAATDDSLLPSIVPGQFNMLYAFGAGEVPISFSGPAAYDGTYVHTIKTLGGVTGALACLREGDSVGVRGPFGRGWPLEQIAGHEVVIVAGGLGLAPLRPLIYSLLAGSHPVAGISLYYGARNPAEILYRDELAQWANKIRVQVTVDASVTDWDGHIGAVTSLLTSASFAPDNAIAFVCGPEVMMRFVIRDLLGKQLSPEAIYLSMERNMKCATGHCGHCQWGPQFICKDGPVFSYRDVQRWFEIREL